MEIFHISAECYPVAKVGGLADVVGALPKYLNKLGHTAKVVVPGYDNKFTNENEFDTIHKGLLKLGWFQFSYTILREKTNKLGFELYLIAIPELFDRPNVYSYDDDTERFTAFQIAFLNWLTETNQQPDVIHCHDHHTGLIPFMVQFCYNYPHFKNTPTVLTIHNGQYQGWFGFDKIHYLPDFDRGRSGFLEWGGIINPLASGIKCAWKVTTVSPSYLDEISSDANGLENLLRFERPKSVGILNGIDVDEFNPETNPDVIPFNKNNLKKKKENKYRLQEKLGLPKSDVALISVVTRLVEGKGLDLVSAVIENLLLYDAIQIVILGSGDKVYESYYNYLSKKYPNKFKVYLGYNPNLANEIYAGSDMFLMPSRYEPCGLSQMIAMRFGTIPIVRETGGLKDTVKPYNIFTDEGNGFSFTNFNADDMLFTIKVAQGVYYDMPETWEKLVKRNMEIDFSWDKSAKEYLELYDKAKKGW